jgi:endo-1,4-beta-xylanase
MIITQPNPGQFDFSRADHIVALAKSHHAVVHGHNLVWDQMYPAWLTNQPWTPAQLALILHTFITTEVTHFRGEVASWDVVNEPLEQHGALRQTLWKNAMGPGYIAQAFDWAHQADPAAKLFINEYGVETVNAKSNGLYTLVKQLLAQRVPISGVGFEFHITTSFTPSVSEIAQNIERFSALGLQVSVSELDVATDPNADPDAQAAAQIAEYQKVGTACHQVAACTSVTTWGMSDALTWKPENTTPLPFNTNFTPKPAYYALTGAIGYPS